VPVGVDGFLVLLLLFVGIAQSRIHLGRAPVVGHRAQHLHGAVGIALFVVEVSEGGDRFFRIRLQLHRCLELALSLAEIVVQPVQAAEEQVVVHVVRLDLDDLLVLLDRQLQHAARTVARLHVSQRAQVDSP
jgi:hypothetical protein